MKRGPGVMGWTVLGLGLAFLYLPMLLVVIYSFNAGRLVTVWAGFSTRWYIALAQDQALIGSVLAGDKAAAWIERFNAAGVPAGPINTIDKVFDDPQVRHLGLSRTFTSPTLGEVTVLGQAIKLSGAESGIARPPPEMGEHSREILAELGFSEDEIDAFARSGVI